MTYPTTCCPERQQVFFYAHASLPTPQTLHCYMLHVTIRWFHISTLSNAHHSTPNNRHPTQPKAPLRKRYIVTCYMLHVTCYNKVVPHGALSYAQHSSPNITSHSTPNFQHSTFPSPFMTNNTIKMDNFAS